MSISAAWELQKGVFSLLDGDATLSAMVGGVFDDVPEVTNYPFVVLTDVIGRDRSATAVPIEQIEFVIEVYSREGGHKEALSIMDRIRELLHGAPISLVGFSLAFIQSQESRLSLGRDAKTYRGAMAFTAMLQPTA